MENLISIVSIVGAALILAVIAFVQMKGNVKEWLLWAVTQAENYLGSGTGALKLRYVYDLAVSQFPVIKYILPFSVFSLWVDEALEIMREEIENNQAIAAFALHTEQEE